MTLDDDLAGGGDPADPGQDRLRRRAKAPKKTATKKPATKKPAAKKPAAKAKSAKAKKDIVDADEPPFEADAPAKKAARTKSAGKN